MDEYEKVRAVEDEIDKILFSLETELCKEIMNVDFDTRNFTVRRVSIYVDGLE